MARPAIDVPGHVKLVLDLRKARFLTKKDRIDSVKYAADMALEHIQRLADAVRRAYQICFQILPLDKELEMSSSLSEQQAKELDRLQFRRKLLIEALIMNFKPLIAALAADNAATQNLVNGLYQLHEHHSILNLGTFDLRKTLREKEVQRDIRKAVGNKRLNRYAVFEGKDLLWQFKRMTAIITRHLNRESVAYEAVHKRFGKGGKLPPMPVIVYLDPFSFLFQSNISVHLPKGGMIKNTAWMLLFRLLRVENVAHPGRERKATQKYNSPAGVYDPFAVLEAVLARIKDERARLGQMDAKDIEAEFPSSSWTRRYRKVI